MKKLLLSCIALSTIIETYIQAAYMRKIAQSAAVSLSKTANQTGVRLYTGYLYNTLTSANDYILTRLQVDKKECQESASRLLGKLTRSWNPKFKTWTLNPDLATDAELNSYQAIKAQYLRNLQEIYALDEQKVDFSVDGYNRLRAELFEQRAILSGKLDKLEAERNETHPELENTREKYIANLRKIEQLNKHRAVLFPGECILLLELEAQHLLIHDNLAKLEKLDCRPGEDPEMAQRAAMLQSLMEQKGIDLILENSTRRLEKSFWQNLYACVMSILYHPTSTTNLIPKMNLHKSW